jgi:hypothetical protein
MSIHTLNYFAAQTRTDELVRRASRPSLRLVRKPVRSRLRSMFLAETDRDQRQLHLGPPRVAP